jgi:hypothetical protein
MTRILIVSALSICLACFPTGCSKSVNRAEARDALDEGQRELTVQFDYVHKCRRSPKLGH